jgi:hypothetical protein
MIFFSYLSFICHVGFILISFLLQLQMLEDFVDVSSDEKDIMHLWNSFVRKQRYLSKLRLIASSVVSIFENVLY